MALPDLRTLDAAAVAAEQEALAQRLRELDPRLDGRGVLGDVLLHAAAAVVQGLRAEIDEVRRLGDVGPLLDAPLSVSEEGLAAVLGNYRLERRAAVAASGRVRVVVRTPVPLVLAAGTAFTSGGVGLVLDAPVAVRADAAQVTGETDLVLRPTAGGLYDFVVPVAAAEAGAAGMLRRGAAAVPSARIEGLVSATVDDDFTGGEDAESPETLAGRLRAGIAPRCFAHRAGVEALLRAEPAFAGTRVASVVGAGDPEMVRDKHGVWPIALLGRCDVYVRTADLPVTETVDVAATLESYANGIGTWRAVLGRDAVPGFYEVEAVLRADGTTADLLPEAERLAAPGAPGDPDVVTALDAAFSPASSALVRFEDASTPAGTAVGAAAAYRLAVSRMPLLEELQAYLAAPEVAPPAGDVLVRAVVPLSVSVDLRVLRGPGAAAPDEAAVAAAVARAVNADRPAPGRLHASELAVAAQAALPPGCTVARAMMTGRLLRPDGTVKRLASPEALVVPGEPDRMVGPRTVAFCASTSAVAVNVQPAG